MKRSKILILVFISILYSRDFTIADPPMIYIYHFVSYDTTSIILNGGAQDEDDIDSSSEWEADECVWHLACYCSADG